MAGIISGTRGLKIKFTGCIEEVPSNESGTQHVPVWQDIDHLDPSYQYTHPNTGTITDIGFGYTLTSFATSPSIFEFIVLPSGTLTLQKLGNDLPPDTNLNFFISNDDTGEVSELTLTSGISWTDSLTLAAGSYTIIEEISEEWDDFTLSGIDSSSEDNLISTLLTSNLAHFIINSGDDFTLSFTNQTAEEVAPQGTVSVQKTFLDSVTIPPASMTFTLTELGEEGTPLSIVVPTTGHGPFISSGVNVNNNQFNIAEVIPFGMICSGIQCDPPSAMSFSNPSTGEATFTVAAGHNTVITFTNGAVPGGGYTE